LRQREERAIGRKRREGHWDKEKESAIMFEGNPKFFPE
jgi:hypothetical protein